MYPVCSFQENELGVLVEEQGIEHDKLIGKSVDLVLVDSPQNIKRFPNDASFNHKIFGCSNMKDLLKLFVRYYGV